MVARRVLAVLVSALLVVPASASPSKASSRAAVPIGICSYVDLANVGGAGALAGTTVFSGDVVEVGPRGSAGILLNNGMQVSVTASSRLQLREAAGGVKQIEMEMFSGTARFRTSATSPVVARLADATARVNGAKPTVGVISLLTSKRAIIGAEMGELLVSTSHDGRSVTLHEGESVELVLSDPAAQSKNEEGSKGVTFTAKQVAIIGGLAALAISLIGITSSSTALTNQQKQNLISPFVFP